MAHEKVYGICDSKCKVEVLPKKQAFGITTVYKDRKSQGSVYLSFPKNGERYIYVNTVGVMHVVNVPNDIDDNYYSEIVVRVKKRVGHPSDFINIPKVQYLNDYLITSDYDVLHYHFTYDGMSICCWCTGYTQPTVI